MVHLQNIRFQIGAVNKIGRHAGRMMSISRAIFPRDSTGEPR